MFKLKTNVYGSAMRRKGALEEIGKNSLHIRNHIIKCVVYRDAIEFKHWVHEIGNWLEEVESVNCKSSLKYNDYREETFGYIGDEPHDARLNLEMFKQKYVEESHQYNDFEITHSLVAELYDVYETLIDASIKWFLQKDNHRIGEWRQKVSEILNYVLE